MNCRRFSWVIAAPIIAVAISCLTATAAARTVISLDGTWNVAEGNMTQEPDRFEHQVPVPGLLDQAEPAFREVGTSSTLRDAFWYIKSFKVKESIPDHAILKIRKAAYGIRVQLNGQHIGDHIGPFTPAYFDVRSALKGAGEENWLVVRVGADRTQLPPDCPDGHDFEKIVYQPGIYDSVELILAGSPYIENVQMVPELESGTARAVVDVQGTTGSVAKVSCVVREVKGGRVAGRAEGSESAGPDGRIKFDLAVKLDKAHLWFPEDPFLYEAEVSTGGDSTTHRFGMRTFRLDQATGRAMLNGKPYFMRGTNVCIFRFFEDPDRGGKPWDKEWVRKLHRSFRDMHWNSIRYCIGFPPAFWYDIADEEGFLIQDEFPIWAGERVMRDCTVETIAGQYKEWMQEHWNHPCVVIWDGQNETVTTKTAAAIEKVRHLDLSNRPWDNGWGPERPPGDVFEAHPYMFINPGARLSGLSSLAPDHLGNPQKNTGGNPMIINEYCWLWLNRDGSATTLTSKLYENLLGTSATAEQRRYTYGRYLAEVTEYWRAGRRFAGILNFCGLSYSRKGGQTSDNFTDLTTLSFEPSFYKYVREAFSPVGICIDNYEEELTSAGDRKVPVVVINDKSDAVECEAVLKLLRGSTVLQSQTRKFRVEALGRHSLPLGLTIPDIPGNYQLVAELKASGQEPVSSLRDIRLLSREEIGIALGFPVAASSSLTKHGGYPAANVTDGNLATRWSSDFEDNQWIAVELKQPEKVRAVELHWERAHAKSYVLEISDDGSSWTEVYRNEDCKGGREKIDLKPSLARFVRMRGMKRATEYGFSLWEMRVFN